MSQKKPVRVTRVQKIEAAFEDAFDALSELPPTKRLAVTKKLAHRVVGRVIKEAEAALDG